MSRVVHLLKFYEDHFEFVKEISQEKYCLALLCFGKRNDSVFQKLVHEFNTENNIKCDANFYKGLSLPRLKMLLALDAQKKGFNSLNPSLSHGLYLGNTPERFQTKFKKLLVPGFWLLGTVINDSLSDDPVVNFGNPFGFKSGDLGFWWAGVISLDWLKYEKTKPKSCKSFGRCFDFYKDPCISRRFLYNKNSALSCLNDIPEQFLLGRDMDLFVQTVERVDLRPRHLWNNMFAITHNKYTGLKKSNELNTDNFTY